MIKSVQEEKNKDFTIVNKGVLYREIDGEELLVIPKAMQLTSLSKHTMVGENIHGGMVRIHSKKRFLVSKDEN